MNKVKHTIKGGHLAVKLDDKWELVFCRGRGLNGNRSTIEITKKRSKALHANAIEYFQQHFPECEFSII